MLYLLLLSVLIYAATEGGKQYGKEKFLRTIESEDAQYLAQNLLIVALGRPLPPDLILWDTDGRTSHYFEDLPTPRYVFFVGSRECGSCIEALDTLSRLLTDAADVSAMFVVVDDEPSFITEPMARRGIVFPVYWDMAQSFRSRYGVPEGVRGNRIYFKLNEEGIVTDWGRFSNSREWLMRIIGDS